jgi:hypothetical protein
MHARGEQRRTIDPTLRVRGGETVEDPGSRRRGHLDHCEDSLEAVPFNLAPAQVVQRIPPTPSERVLSKTASLPGFSARTAVERDPAVSLTRTSPHDGDARQRAAKTGATEPAHRTMAEANPDLGRTAGI